MTTIKQASKKICIDCMGGVKDPRANRCRNCWNIYYRKNPNRAFMERNINWKGDVVGYNSLHKWIRRHKPKPLVCEICKENNPKQVANISGKYKRDINDYQWLCVRCHVYKDETVYNLKTMKGGKS